MDQDHGRATACTGFLSIVGQIWTPYLSQYVEDIYARLLTCPVCPADIFNAVGECACKPGQSAEHHLCFVADIGCDCCLPAKTSYESLMALGTKLGDAPDAASVKVRGSGKPCSGGHISFSTVRVALLSERETAGISGGAGRDDRH